MAVLNDFGLARSICSNLFITTKTAGNAAWTAPEILLSEDESYQHTTQSDVWACGMTLRVSTGTAPIAPPTSNSLHNVRNCSGMFSLTRDTMTVPSLSP